jgi:RHS repeat-associated protein
VTAGSTVNYTYDAAGNVTSDGVHSFTYDAENRVVSVDGGTTATYSYDHANRRVKKVVGSTTTHYVWEGGQVIAEHNGSTGAVITEYIIAGGRMIAREGGGRVFFLYDRLSVRATITDGQGGIQGRQSHLPFGEELVATGTTDKHRFTSYERDGETGTDYAVNRTNSPSIGRFFQVDKVAGDGSPQRLNRYAYTRNDPINKIDRLGLDDCPPGSRSDGQGGCVTDGDDIDGGTISMGDDFIDPFFGDLQRLLDADGFIDPRNISQQPVRPPAPRPIVVDPSVFLKDDLDKGIQGFLKANPDCKAKFDQKGWNVRGALARATFYDVNAIGRRRASRYFSGAVGNESVEQYFSRTEAANGTP